jgi:hypothetical protein
MQHPGYDPNASCTCADARMINGWCRRCNAGFVAGRQVECALLFDALDPHGHDLMIGELECAACRDAARTNGFCDVDGMGFVDVKAYFTRLTHGLATGQAIDVQVIRCGRCRENSQADSGWCEACGRGMVGNVAIEDQAVFDATAKEFAILEAAISRAPSCELCACAMVVHRACPTCRTDYREAWFLD